MGIHFSLSWVPYPDQIGVWRCSFFMEGEPWAKTLRPDQNQINKINPPVTVRNLNLGHFGGRRAFLPLHHHCSHRRIEHYWKYLLKMASCLGNKLFVKFGSSVVCLSPVYSWRRGSEETTFQCRSLSERRSTKRWGR